MKDENMNRRIVLLPVLLFALLLGAPAARAFAPEDSIRVAPIAPGATVLTLDDALKIALSESETIKIADKEVERSGYARKGTYAALYPQIDIVGSYQRTLIKNDIRAMMGSDSPMAQSMPDTKIGNFNTFSASASASMPIINAALWKSLKISGQSVELAVEKARESRLNLISQVKQGYYAALLAKEALSVYLEVYENAKTSYIQTEKKYNVQKASELDMITARTSLASAVPDVYNAESTVILALWQLKAVIGMKLEEEIDVAGTLEDYAQNMEVALSELEGVGLERSSALRQISLQSDQLLETVRLKQLAYVPTISLTATFTYSAVANDPIQNLGWFPYSYAGISLAIPIFSGTKRLQDVRAARSQYQQMQLTAQSTEKQLRIRVRQELSSMETAARSFDASREALVSAEKAYEIAAKSYEVGRATILELGNAQLALTRSRLAVIQPVYTFISSKAELESILGLDQNE